MDGDQQVFGLTKNAAERTGRAVNEVLRTLPPQPGIKRRLSGVPSDSCDAQNAIIGITLFGPPTSGTWSLPSWTIDGSTDSISSLSYSISAASLQTAIEGHSGVGSGNVTVTGGAANAANFHVEFIGDLANLAVDAPIVNYSSLGGTGIGGLAWHLQIGR